MVSWAITAFYYRQSSVRTPEWAREFVLKLPDRPISQKEFARLFNESIKGVSIDGGTF